MTYLWNEFSERTFSKKQLEWLTFQAEAEIRQQLRQNGKSWSGFVKFFHFTSNLTELRDRVKNLAWNEYPSERHDLDRLSSEWLISSRSLFGLGDHLLKLAKIIRRDLAEMGIQLVDFWQLFDELTVQLEARLGLVWEKNSELELMAGITLQENEFEDFCRRLYPREKNQHWTDELWELSRVKRRAAEKNLQAILSHRCREQDIVSRLAMEIRRLVMVVVAAEFLGMEVTHRIQLNKPAQELKEVIFGE